MTAEPPISGPHDEDKASISEATQPEPVPRTKWLSKLTGTKKAQVVTGVTVAGLLVIMLMLVPATRYGILGQVIKRQVMLEVTDSRTHKPVSDVTVSIGGAKAKTDAKGKVSFAHVPAGPQQVSANKKYYDLKTTSLKVPLWGKAAQHKLELVAIGNQVTVKVINKITGQPAAKASIAVLGTTATTDSNGEAVIVLPASQTSRPGTVNLAGYNDLAVSIQNSEALTAANTFALVPSGKIYFLSKRTGKINVMKSDLDGGNPSVVLAGTGKEEETETVLLATRDWKYLALKARRDSEQAKLYIINTATDKLDVMDEGRASFIPVGWSGHHFVFSLNRLDVKYWEPKQFALKSYDADKDSLKTLDETEAEGNESYNAIQSMGGIYLANGSAVYTKAWNAGNYNMGLMGGKKTTINSVSLDSGTRTVLKDFDAKANAYINAALYAPSEVIFQLTETENNGPAKYSFYELEDGKVSATTNITNSDFAKFYPTYIQSPSGKETFWYEPRDGKNTLFAGTDEGKNAKELATLSEYTPYGWYTDDYVLVTKKGSELYIASKDFKGTPLKVTDYHKPNFNGNGYGGGYGAY